MDTSVARSEKRCEYCGNNQVAHFLTWYFESINIFFAPVRQFLLKSWVAGAIQGLAAKLNFPLNLVKILSYLGIISFQKQRSLCKVSRAEVLWKEAENRGIEFYELKLLGKAFDTYFAKKSKLEIIFSGLPRPKDYSRFGLDLMDDKIFLKSLLRKAGLPVPTGDGIAFFWQAEKIFKRLEKPVIVKPRTGSRGRHSTTFIYTPKQLKEAFKIAKVLCFWVIVEEQLMGPVYRATVIDYKLAGVVRGDAPGVVGDGKHTIQELVEIKNQELQPPVANIVIDETTQAYLQRQGLKLLTVPKPGENIVLSEKIGISYGGSSSEDFAICHLDNKELFVKAARVIGDPLVGLDFIIQDITKSYKEQRCGFIEANSLPFINLHHHPLHGQPQNAAAMVWDMMGM